jgi:hypothetical protein
MQGRHLLVRQKGFRSPPKKNYLLLAPLDAVFTAPFNPFADPAQEAARPCCCRAKPP